MEEENNENYKNDESYINSKILIEYFCLGAEYYEEKCLKSTFTLSFSNGLIIKFYPNGDIS